jgi:agmatine deiminase
VWLGYDANPEFSAVSVRMAAALLPYTSVVIAAEDEQGLAHARSAAAKAGLDDSRLSFVHNQASRFFIRDYNVFSVGPAGLGVVDFEFNTYGLPGWCANHLYPEAPDRAKRCANSVDPIGGNLDRWIGQHRKAQTLRSPLFLEGGAIELNGQGTLLVSEPLALQRNSGSTRAQLETHFLQLPGVRKVIWLAEGPAEDPHMKATITGDFIGFGAGSHTDEFVRFADPRTILLAWVEKQEQPLHPVEAITSKRMHQNYEILSRSSDQDGRPFKIVKVPMPAPITREIVLQEKAADMETWTTATFPASEGRKVGDRLTHVAASSYLNYIVATDLVLLPDYVGDGTPVALQARVRDIFKAAFPGRDIKFINVTRLNWAGGGIHCATCNEPAIS